MHKLFVYGTLKKAYGNHRCLHGSKHLLDTVIRDNFFLVDLGPFPAAIYDPNKRYNIYGEIYEIDDNILRRCDALEGYPSFYNRSQIVLDTVGPTWIYHFNEQGKYNGYEKIERWERTMPMHRVSSAS